MGWSAGLEEANHALRPRREVWQPGQSARPRLNPGRAAGSRRCRPSFAAQQLCECRSAQRQAALDQEVAPRVQGFVTVAGHKTEDVGRPWKTSKEERKTTEEREGEERETAEERENARPLKTEERRRLRH